MMMIGMMMTFGHLLQRYARHLSLVFVILPVNKMIMDNDDGNYWFISLMLVMTILNDESYEPKHERRGDHCK